MISILMNDEWLLMENSVMVVKCVCNSQYIVLPFLFKYL